MDGVDPGLVGAWLAARSTVRGLPQPCPDQGGWRVDTGQAEEQRRYVFAAPCDGLRRLGAAIDAPLVALKLCGSGETLMALLPPRWRLADPAWLMVRDRRPAASDAPAPLAPGYRLGIARRGAMAHVRIEDEAGVLAAEGHAIEADGLFVYDRIRTEAAHRRRGLGRALMRALAQCRAVAAREILAAIPAGRGLYATLGWQDLADYATATIPA